MPTTSGMSTSVLRSLCKSAILVALGLGMLSSAAAADTPCRDAITCWRQCRLGDGAACTASPGSYRPVDRGPERPPRPLRRPRYRLEALIGGRSNVGLGHGSRTTGGYELVRRFGPVEIGPGVSFVEPRTLWQQQSFLAHVRWPLDLTGTRMSVVPRVALGVLTATGEVTSSAPGTLPSFAIDRVVTPAAELGLTLERRWHRIAVGLDVGAGLHVRQRLMTSTARREVPPHAEGLVTVRVGLLLS